jgi:serine protease Do
MSFLRKNQFDDYHFTNYEAAYRGYVRRRRPGGIIRFTAILLSCCILTGLIAGGGVYLKLSEKINYLELMVAAQSENYIKSDYNGLTIENMLMANNGSDSTVTKIAKKVGPSIVGIRMVTQSPRTWYFGDTMSQSESEGSGIIIDSNGYIMTNYHVVQYADPKNSTSKNTTLEVFLSDGEQAMAKFIGGDQKSDLAVIKIDKKKLPKAKLGDSDTLEVGELAVAIGNPLGLEFQGSVTVGVISALNRTISIDDRTMNLIQTDAAINPGNSGGALLNSKGEVIGINTIKISISGVEGLGFAIPVNEAKPIVDQLIMFGYVKGRPYIGISGREITETLSYLYDIPVGIYILDVVKDSGAEKAGIRKGDTLVSLDGVDVRTMKEVDTIKDKYKAGDTVSAVVVRNGKKIKLSLTFTEDK